MSMRECRPAAKTAVAVATLIVGSAVLSGCSSLGSRTFGDPVTTGSLQQRAPQSVNQPMPSNLGAPQTLVAEQQFLPPEPIGGGGVGNWNSQPASPAPAWNQPSQPAWNQPSMPMATASAPTIQSQDLPALSSPSQGSLPAMPAQTALASAAPAPSPAVLGSLPTNSSVPTVAATAPTVAPAAANSNGAYYHTIASGESLYTIARRYDVTTQAIVQANNLGSPDRITVGQKVLIPGRSDLVGTQQPVQVASATPPTTAAPAQPLAAPVAPAQQAATPPVVPAAAPQQPAPAQVAATPAPSQPVAPAAEPAMSGSDKFRWPVSGRILVDFAASRGTGINIEAAEGTPVKAAENGTVIYVGSGVEGYGNLVLIRHPNGYVSAYAHLSSMSVAKGATVNRGDTIGAAGKTGSVTQSQLHFELRKGATPVDPMPLLS